MTPVRPHIHQWHSRKGSLVVRKSRKCGRDRSLQAAPGFVYAMLCNRFRSLPQLCSLSFDLFKKAILILRAWQALAVANILCPSRSNRNPGHSLRWWRTWRFSCYMPSVAECSASLPNRRRSQSLISRVNSITHIGTSVAQYAAGDDEFRSRSTFWLAPPVSLWDQ